MSDWKFPNTVTCHVQDVIRSREISEAASSKGPAIELFLREAPKAWELPTKESFSMSALKFFGVVGKT
ncbi:hypothetical protein J6590_086095 [Homalodisca vitripennis]|nr:hypothetical protein J6590_086095 [Homalodisca vitripennis]